METNEENGDTVPLLRLPMRLFMQNGRPVTDRDGILLTNIAGKPLAKIEIDNFTFIDNRGKLLTDASSKNQTDLGFNPTKKPSNEMDKDYIIPTIIFDSSGYPLTDNFRRPLINRDGTMNLKFGPRNEPISDIYGGPLLDKMGNDITIDQRPLIDVHGNPLYVYDRLRRPLTDENGFPLMELSGVKLIVFDQKRNPVKIITGGQIYDAKGNCKDHEKFDLTKKVPVIAKEIVTTKDGEIALAFDINGHPLTDYKGNVLCFATGQPMITYNNEWFDWKREKAIIIRKSIYIPYSLYGFKNSEGVPIRLFDHSGRPLTDADGAPQNHASGPLLLKFDQEGDPISDWKNRQIFDANGFSIQNEYFRPCIAVKTTIPSERQKNPQSFDRFGFPLTNRMGVPLINANDEIREADGVFDILGLPVNPNLENPLEDAHGLPIRLYNSKGMPLTDIEGRPLRHIRGHLLISLGPGGQIENEFKGGKLFDRKMRSTSFVYDFNASLRPKIEEKIDIIMKSTGEPLHLFDCSGYPLTDINGIVLFDSKGRSLIKCPKNGFITTDEGDVFDVNGFKCLRVLDEAMDNKKAIFDQNGRPLTNHLGQLLKNRLGKELVIPKRKMQYNSLTSWSLLGKTQEALCGGTVYDVNNIEHNDPNSDVFKSPTWVTHIIFDGVQLFDCQDYPLTDEFGGLLYTSSGIPLIQFNSRGRPKCDHAGRTLFDSRAIPLSKSGGYWKNQNGKALRFFDKTGLPLTDSDGKDLKDIDGKSLIRRDELGRPKYDTNNCSVCDINGKSFDSQDFNPTLGNSNKLVCLKDDDGFAIRVYNCHGLPLTDGKGNILVTSKGKMLLDLKDGESKLKDNEGKTVYDEFMRPFGCDERKPILNMLNKPLLLYNEKGEPLTSMNGVILKNDQVLVTFDKYGRPFKCQGGNLYDVYGNILSCEFDDKSISSISTSNESVLLFDDAGVPLTDETGKVISSGGCSISTKFTPNQLRVKKSLF